MERRAREPVAMLTCCELIRCDAVLEFLTFAIRIPETGAVRERHMAGQHCIGDLDHRFRTRTLRDHAHAAAALHSKLETGASPLRDPDLKKERSKPDLAIKFCRKVW